MSEKISLASDGVRGIVDLAGNVRPPQGDIILSSGVVVGMGDHALYSTLAKRFSELGCDVYLDKDILVRNDEIGELFYAQNPYLKGLSDKKPNAGYCRQGLFYEIANRYPIGSMEAMERAHGLPPPYSIAPWAAYQPKPFHIDISKHVLVDFSAVSSKVGPLGIGECLRAMQGRFRVAPFLQILHPKHVAIHDPEIACESIFIPSVFAYLDALASCRAWVGGEAGGQALAAIVRGEHDVYDLDARPEIVCTATPKTFNSRGYTFRGVDYRVTSQGQDNTGDYFFPHEMQTHSYELQAALSQQIMQSRA